MKSSRKNEQSSGKKQLRVFVDANTIISGLLFEGNEALLLKLGAIGACSLVTTRHVLDEVNHTLGAEEFQLSPDVILKLLSYVNKCVVVHEDLTRTELRKYTKKLDDEKDTHVLAAFEKLKCDVLVTGDKELLRKVSGAKTTRQVLKILLDQG